MASQEQKVMTIRMHKGLAHCPICTHTVEAEVVTKGRHVFTRPGQKCPRCNSSLDPAGVVRFDKAA